MAYSNSTSDYPFPRPCSECGQEQVYVDFIEYDAEVKHDGNLHAFHIPKLTVNKCKACGEVYFDTITSEEISLALRDHLHLLSPQQIRKGLKSLGLKQNEFGERIGAAAETISRWLSGTHIQSRAYDNLMRLFFEFDNVRTKLSLPRSPKKETVAGLLTTGTVTLEPHTECYLSSSKSPKPDAIFQLPCKISVEGVLSAGSIPGFNDILNAVPIPQWNDQGLLGAWPQVSESNMAAENNLATAA